MATERIATIEDWPTLISILDVQVLLGFANFYRRFIKKYGNMMLSSSDVLKTMTETAHTAIAPGKTLRTRNKHLPKWERTREAELVGFCKLNRAFTDAHILQHFKPAKPQILQTDASGFAITSIVNQYDVTGTL